MCMNVKNNMNFANVNFNMNNSNVMSVNYSNNDKASASYSSDKAFNADNKDYDTRES